MTKDQEQTTTRPRRVGPITVIIMLLLMISGTILLTHLMGVKPAELLANLDSGDAGTVSDSLAVLQARRDPAALGKAAQLLNSDDAEVWLAAAFYLGSFQRQQAVEYLIKGFRCAPRQRFADLARELAALTGQDFGANYGAWHRWWILRHPDSTFDFSTHLQSSAATMPNL